MSSYEDHEIEKWQYLGVCYRATADQANQIQLLVERTQVYRDWLAAKDVLELIRVRDVLTLDMAREAAMAKARLSPQITETVLQKVREVLGEDGDL